jgi:hypothetical protein
VRGTSPIKRPVLGRWMTNRPTWLSENGPLANERPLSWFCNEDYGNSGGTFFHGVHQSGAGYEPEHKR